MYKVQSTKNHFFAQCTKYKTRKIVFLLNVQSTKYGKSFFCSMYKVQNMKNRFFAQCTKYKARKISFLLNNYLGKAENNNLKNQ